MVELAWGRRYLTVAPEHFRIDYRINPFMDPGHQPDPKVSAKQWDAAVAAMRAVGAEVEVLGQPVDVPDMVYAQNLGLVWQRSGERHVLMSHMRFPQRRRETPVAAAWFAEHGFRVHWLGEEPTTDDQFMAPDNPAPAFEAGDAFWWRGEMIVGHGPRTDLAAVALIREQLGVRTHAIHTTHPAMFHLDLSFCPVTEDTALVCPSAFDSESAELIMSLVPDPIVLTTEQALTFTANCVVVGSTVLGAGLDPEVSAALAERGLRIEHLDLSQFHLSGGSIRCLTNPLDISLD